MAEQKLDLVQLAARHVTQARARAAEIVRGELVDADTYQKDMDRLAHFIARSGFSRRSE